MHNLIIISNPVAVANEANIINALFDEGMEIFHLRKPGGELVEIKILLDEIKPKYRNQVALHQYHAMAGGFGTNRLHFTEKMRKETTERELIQLKNGNNILSTSVHEVSEYLQLPVCFDYTFFGPVFNSISKQGYTSTLDSDFVFPAKVGQPKVVAIGGIDATSIQKALSMNFRGVAALGTIWQEPGDSIEKFKKLQKEWNKAGR